MENRFEDPFKPQGIPQGLKVLTVLSIIGSAIQFISTAGSFFFAKYFYNTQMKQAESMQNNAMPEWVKKMAPEPEAAKLLAQNMYDNRIPLFILGLVAVGLCFYGVLEMRKMKARGFTFYVIGELLPFLSMALFLGTVAMSGFGFYFSVFIAVLFIGLYAMYRGRMKEEVS